MENPFKKPVAHIGIKKIKAGSSFKADFTNMSKHNFRLDDVKPMNPELTENNIILIDAQKYPFMDTDGSPIYDDEGHVREHYDFPKQVEEILSDKGLHPRKDAVEVVQVFMEVTGGYKNLPEGFDQQQWIDESMKWLKDTWGEQNIVSAVVHVDEFTPHIHAMVLPITEDNRLCCRDWLHKSSDYYDMQKSYYEATKQPGISQCQSGMKMPFSGPDSQRRAQNALNRAGEEVDINLERLPGEGDRQYSDRVTEQVREFAMGKELELEDEFRKMSAENMRIQREKEEAEKKADEYKKKYEEEKRSTRFYSDQINGYGLSQNELKHTEEAVKKITAEFEAEKKTLQDTNLFLRGRVDELSDQVTELKKEVATQQVSLESYQEIMDASGLTPENLKLLQTARYMMIGLQNNCPGAEETKKGTVVAVKCGKEIVARNKELEHEKEDI